MAIMGSTDEDPPAHGPTFHSLMKRVSGTRYEVHVLTCPSEGMATDPLLADVVDAGLAIQLRESGLPVDLSCVKDVTWNYPYRRSIFPDGFTYPLPCTRLASKVKWTYAADS